MLRLQPSLIHASFTAVTSAHLYSLLIPIPNIWVEERIVIAPQMVPISQLVLLAIRALQKLEDAAAS